VYQQAFGAVALPGGFAGLASTTGLVVAEQYAWLILPVSFLTGLGLVVVGVVSDPASSVF